MKKFIIPMIISVPLLVSTSSFSASSSDLYNPQSRTSTVVSTNINAVPKAGASYAYWHHRHWHYNRYWHHWHHRYHWY